MECVTSQHLALTHAVFPAGRSYALSLSPVALRANAGGPSGLHIGVRIGFSVLTDDRVSGQAPRVDVQAYQYSLLDRNQRELLVYHWHPHFAGPSYPHLHVSASLDAQFNALTRRKIDLDKRHLATGPVSLAAFVRMLISEFEVLPQRADWEARLAATDAH